MIANCATSKMEDIKNDLINRNHTMRVKCYFEQFKMYLEAFVYDNDIKQKADYSKFWI